MCQDQSNELSELLEAAYYHCHPLLEAGKLVDPKQLINNTDLGRIQRGEHAHLVDHKIVKADPVKYGAGYKQIQYSVLSEENTESMVHLGYITFYPSNRKVRELFCNCADWFNRLQQKYVKAGLATNDLPEPYKKMYQDRVAEAKIAHTKALQNAAEREAQGKPPRKEEVISPDLFICKHIYCAFDNVLNQEKLAAMALDDTNIPDKVDMTLRNKIQKQNNEYIKKQADMKKTETSATVPLINPTKRTPIAPKKSGGDASMIGNPVSSAVPFKKQTGGDVSEVI